MLKIHTLPLGNYQTNTYIVHDSESTACAIIDPGFEAGTILAKVKALGLRVFEDENGKMNRGLEAVGGEVLVVSQFTLYGNCRKGRRPSFTDAAGPELGNALYEKFLSICAELGYPPQHGRFGADMKVASVNDGPVTLILDTDQLMDTPRK